jgi:hypothetical protein
VVVVGFPAAREGSTAVLNVWVGVQLSLRWGSHGGEDEGRSDGAAERDESFGDGGDAGIEVKGNGGYAATASTEGGGCWSDEDATGLS